MSLCMKQILLILFITVSMNLTAQNIRSSVHVLSDNVCDILSNAAKEKSAELGLDISFAIADADGLPRLFRRFGNALVLSTILVPDKAYTAAITMTPTDALAPLVADGGNLMGINTCDLHITVVPGGLPLFVDGQIVGAIGIGGGSKEQDMEIAHHVLEKFNKLFAH